MPSFTAVAGAQDEVCPVSVVVPTIGRPELLAKCLASIAACHPGPAEVVVVDQSGGGVADVVAAHAHRGMRTVRCDGVGIARATNAGLRAASSDHVLVTHDDCRVARDWVAVAARGAAETPDTIITGRVLPGGDPRAVPSTRTDEVPADYTGTRASGVLYPANMVLPRRSVLEFGGFDERPSLRRAAEDNDLCYRWLRAGRGLRFEPDLVVTHADWRTPAELEELYVAYWRGEGAFLAKHLLAGDRHAVRMLRYAVRGAARAFASRIKHGTPRWTDARRGALRGLPAGLLAGTRDELALRVRRRRARGR